MAIQIRRKHEKTPYLQLLIVAEDVDTRLRQLGYMPASGQILRELNCIHLHEVLEKKLVKEFYALLRKYDMLTEKKKLYESAAHRVNG